MSYDRERSNVVPFVDYRERWPVDYRAAALGDQVAVGGTPAGPRDTPEPPWLQVSDDEMDAAPRGERWADVRFCLAVFALWLGAMLFAVVSLAEIADPAPVQVPADDQAVAP